MPMDLTWSGSSVALLVAVFLTAALALEGAVLLWQMNRGRAALRLKRRLQAWVPELEDGARTPTPQVPWLPRAWQSSMALQLEQAGWGWSPVALISLCAVLGLLTSLAALTVAPGMAVGSAASGPLQTLMALVAGAVAASAPMAALWHRRARRLTLIGLQLPAALDLMARALRSGHAFSSALQMVAQESPEPIASTLGRVQEQIGWGREPDEALDDLARRVPSDDVRFLVIAVKLQRQTGGALAEVLGNIADLVRDRQRLLDRVRVLTAEGRLSAQVLAAMPPLTALAIHLLKPDFIAVLWTDPAGWRWLQASAVLFAAGVVWLWRLTRIRV